MTDLERVPDWMLPDTTHPARLDLKSWAQDFRDVYQISEALCRTPFVPREMLGKQADVAAAILKGRELGLDPFDALGSIYIVNGRVGYYAEFLRRRIIQAGHSLRIVESTDSRCVIEGIRKDSGETHRASFTAEQARKGGIDISKFPSDKLIARATSRLCKQAFPDVLSGSLIAEDLIDGVIPADSDTQAAEAPRTPAGLRRRRAVRAAKAAATQPPPAVTEPDPDIAELLGDEEPAPSTEKDTPPEPPSGDEPPTPAMNRKMHALFREAGLTARSDRLVVTAAIIGRPIDSGNAIFKDEAARLIDTLEQWQQDGVTEQKVTDAINTWIAAQDETRENT